MMKSIAIKVCIILSLLATRCGKPEIVITHEYVMNDQWTEREGAVNANSFTITRLVLRNDSTIEDVIRSNQSELLRKLVHDSSYNFQANVRLRSGMTYKNTKIYFNKDNGFKWRNDSTGEEVSTIGNLSPGTWYGFLGLRHSPIYIYVDSSYGPNRFDLNTSNF